MIRLIIKRIDQPPMDTPARIDYLTHDIEDKKLEELLKSNDYLTTQVCGSEIVVKP